jgi:hypothetical protein
MCHVGCFGKEPFHDALIAAFPGSGSSSITLGTFTEADGVAPLARHLRGQAEVPREGDRLKAEALAVQLQVKLSGSNSFQLTSSSGAPARARPSLAPIPGSGVRHSGTSFPALLTVRLTGHDSIWSAGNGRSSACT